jgi:hypothetical protein
MGLALSITRVSSGAPTKTLGIVLAMYTLRHPFFSFAHLAELIVLSEIAHDLTPEDGFRSAAGAMERTFTHGAPLLSGHRFYPISRSFMSREAGICANQGLERKT